MVLKQQIDRSFVPSRQMIIDRWYLVYIAGTVLALRELACRSRFDTRTYPQRTELALQLSGIQMTLYATALLIGHRGFISIMRIPKIYNDLNVSYFFNIYLL